MLALTLIAVVLRPAAPARANGVPMRIPLAYLPNLSNWGPTDATGEADLSYSEGIILITARGLGDPGAGHYAVWLVRSATNRALSAGTFTPKPDGTIAFQGKLGALTSYDYDLIILTLQDTGDPAAGPSANRSIGGFFTPVQPVATATPGIDADSQPQTLPDTGDVPIGNSSTVFGVSRHQLAFALFALGGLLFAWVYVRKRRLRD